MTGTKWDQADLVSLLHSGDLGFGRCDCHAASGTVGTQQSLSNWLSKTRSKRSNHSKHLKALKGSCVILVDLLMKPHSFSAFQAFSSAEINRHHQSRCLRQVATCLAFVEARTMMQSVAEFSLKTCTLDQLHQLHQLQRYSYNGSGIKIFEATAEIMLLASRVSSL